MHAFAHVALEGEAAAGAVAVCVVPALALLVREPRVCAPRASTRRG